MNLDCLVLKRLLDGIIEELLKLVIIEKWIYDSYQIIKKDKIELDMVEGEFLDAQELFSQGVSLEILEKDLENAGSVLSDYDTVMAELSNSMLNNSISDELKIEIRKIVGG